MDAASRAVLFLEGLKPLFQGCAVILTFGVGVFAIARPRTRALMLLSLACFVTVVTDSIYLSGSLQTQWKITVFPVEVRRVLFLLAELLFIVRSVSVGRSPFSFSSKNVARVFRHLTNEGNGPIAKHVLASVRAAVLLLVSGLVLTTGACSRRGSAEQTRDYSTVEMIGARNMFMGGVITPAPSGDFLVIVELTPAKHDDGEKMCNLLRAGHRVSLRLREEPNEAPILVSDVTSRAEAIIRCKTMNEAKKVIDRLHAWPSR